jgi:hypothetical protein
MASTRHRRQKHPSWRACRAKGVGIGIVEQLNEIRLLTIAHIGQLMNVKASGLYNGYFVVFGGFSEERDNGMKAAPDASFLKVQRQEVKWSGCARSRR